ncbi:YesL family protein [Bacillus nitroreducens]
MVLNILFILSCIPIVTIYPALAALFGVVREWRTKNEVAVYSQYKKKFIENWKQSYLVGILFTIIGYLLISNLLFLNQVDIPYKPYIYLAYIFIAFLVFLSFISIYPLMVNTITSFKKLCVSSLQFGLYKIHLSIFCMIILIAWAILSLNFPFLIFFFFFSVAADFIYWVADRKFTKLIPQEKSDHTETSVVTTT